MNVENRGNGLSPRFGSSVLNVNGSGYPSPIAGNPDIMSNFGFAYGSASHDTLFAASTSLYSTPASPVAIRTGLTSGLRHQFEKAGEIAYGTNGTDAAYFYDPARSTTATYTVGYATPSAFTATPGGGGSMANGTYDYYVTLYDSNTETESNRQAASVAAVVVAGPNGSVALTVLPTDSEARSTHHIIYRRDPSGFYFYRLVKIAYVAAGSYTDTAAATGSTFIAPTDNFRPDPSEVICLYDNKMIYCQNNILTWSKNFRFQSVPTFNRETLNDNSRKITRAVSFRKNVLVIFKTQSIYVALGDLNGDYQVKQVSKTIGTRSPDTVRLGPNGIFFLDSNGKPRVMNSTDFEAEDLRDSTDISYKYRKKFDLIPRSKLSYCHAVLWETSAVSQYRIFVPIDTTGNYPNHCYVYDYGLARRNGGDSAWFDYHYMTTAVCSTVVQPASAESQLHVGDDYGLMWRLDHTNRYYDGDELFRAEGEGTVTILGSTIDVSTLAMAIDRFVGLQLIAYNRYTYQEVYRSRITANTATMFTLEDVVPPVASSDLALSVGGYIVFFATANYTHDRAGNNRPFKASVLFSTDFAAAYVHFFTHYDFNEVFNFTYDYINNTANPSMTPLADNYLLALNDFYDLYDDAIYDTDRYGVAHYATDEIKLNSKYLFDHVSWGIITRRPNTPFGYIGSTLYYQPKRLTT